MDLGLHSPVAMAFALIGSPGSGKSETANTILGEVRMKTSCTSEIVTENIQCGYVNKNGIDLTVIDTPGFISTHDFVATLREIDRMEVQNVIYGITLRIGRTTEKEIAVLFKILTDPKILNYLRHRTCFVFTSRDEFLDFDSDSTMLEDGSLNNLFNQWLVKSPIIMKMIHSNNYTYCAITNRLKWENRNKESNKLITKIIETYEACPESDKRKLGRKEDLYDGDRLDEVLSSFIMNNEACPQSDNQQQSRKEDFADDDRLDEVLSFTVREIRNLLTEVRQKEKDKAFVPLGRNHRLADEATRLIFQTLRHKGSSLNEKDIKTIFGYEVSSCVIF